MVIEFRLYKRFDSDLIALVKADYPVANMMRDAVVGYANGSPVHYYVDEFTDFDINDDKTIHSRFRVPDSDVKTCYMLQHIKYRCRNSFVKAVLRNALVQQNLTCYFSDVSLVRLQNDNLAGINLYQYSNLIPCSSIKAERKQIEFIGETVTLTRGRKRKDRAQEMQEFSVTRQSQKQEYNPFTAPAQMQAVQYTASQGVTSQRTTNLRAVKPQPKIQIQMPQVTVPMPQNALPPNTLTGQSAYGAYGNIPFPQQPVWNGRAPLPYANPQERNAGAQIVPDYNGQVARGYAAQPVNAASQNIAPQAAGQAAEPVQGRIQGVPAQPYAAPSNAQGYIIPDGTQVTSQPYAAPTASRSYTAPNGADVQPETSGGYVDSGDDDAEEGSYLTTPAPAITLADNDALMNMFDSL